MNQLQDFISRHARRTPDAPALEDSTSHLTYADFNNEVDIKAEQFRQSYGTGKPIILRARQDIGFITDYFAVHRSGNYAVPIEHDLPEERERAIRQMTDHTDIPADTADILFTTGSTGREKGVLLSHRALIADAENLISGQQFHEGMAFVINGPLNHIGSLSKLWPTVIVGGKIVVTAGMKDINAYIAAISRQTLPVATFLVPTSIHILLTFGSKQLGDLQEKIEFIETGAAPITEQDMRDLHTALPRTRLYNTYASTETGIICTYDYANNPIIAGCLGRPMPHSSIAIADDGCIVCAGPTLMSGYAGGRENIVSNGKIHTTDRARIDDLGNLHLMGRNDNIINSGGYKIAPEEVEEVALQYPAIADCICIPARHPVAGTVAALLYVPKEGEKISKRELALFVSSKLERYKTPQIFREVQHIERTFNGKLNRKYYH